MSYSFVFKISNKIADFKSIISLKEQKSYSIEIDPLEEMDVNVCHNQKELRLVQVFRREKTPNYIFKSKIRFESIGIHSIKLRVNETTFEQKLRVLPIKISQEEYEIILNQIRVEAYNIIFRIFGKSEEEIRLQKGVQPKSPIEFFSFFEKNFEAFKRIFQRIEKDPNVIVKEKMTESEFFETANFDEVLEYEKPLRKISPLQNKLRGLLPKIVTNAENFLSFDVYENRLLKHFLGLIITKLNYLEEVALCEKRRQIENQEVYGSKSASDSRSNSMIEKWQKIIEKCRQYKREAKRMRTKPFLAVVEKICLVKTSMVLQKEPRYKAFYNLYREFQKNSVIEVHSNYFHMSIKEIWRIYEIWVLLKIYESLRKTGFKIRKQRLVNVEKRNVYNVKKVRFNFGLTRNRPLLELYKNKKIVMLYYQRRYSRNFPDYGSVDLEQDQIPDVAIEIFKEGETFPEIIIIDPKYRVKGNKPPESAKKALSHYVNMIRNKSGKRLVKQAYLVYPGSITKSTEQGDYGYIGLLPRKDIGQFEQKIIQMVN